MDSSMEMKPINPEEKDYERACTTKRIGKNEPSYWAVKRAIEAEYGDFLSEPRFDVFHADFDLIAFAERMNAVNNEAGWPTGNIALSWENLTVRVPVETGAEFNTIWTQMLGPLQGLVKAIRCQCTTTTVEQNIIDGVSGFLDPGTTCLVLSPPGAGTSTLLRILSGRREGFEDKIDGKVLYDGLEPSKAVRHTSRLVGQADVHFAPLSVRQTLQFAADCTIPDYLPYAEQMRKIRPVLISRLLGIERNFETPVGDDQLRGVSGGEKKRVTIAEIAVSPAPSLMFLDNFTKGLDAATSLDIVRTVSRTVKLSKASVMASMQQPSNEIFNEFDKLLLLDHGKCLFFGPTSEAEGYFNSLGYVRPPARSLPDFVATVSDPVAQGELLKAGFESTAPKSVDEFDAAYKSSQLCEDVKTRLAEGVVSDRQRLSPEYIAAVDRNALLSKRQQAKNLVRRGFMLELLDTRTLVAGVLAFCVMGLLLGSIFFDLSLDISGQSTRAGILFTSMTFVGFSAIGTLPKKFLQKLVYTKQFEAGFYGPIPYIVSNALVDASWMFVKAGLFTCSLYFLAGFQLGGGRGAIFFLIVLSLGLCMEAIVRLASVVAPDKDTATGLLGLYLVLIIIFCGYIIPRDNIAGYFIWIYWISPFRYAYEALIQNEFFGLTFFCTPEQLLPPDPNIEDIYKTCSGGPGENYVVNALGMYEMAWMKWVDISVLLAIYFLVICLTAYMQTKVKTPSFRYKKLGVDETQDEYTEPVTMLDDECTSTHVPVEEATAAATVDPIIFSWSSLNYDVPIGKKDRKQLLCNVFGVAKPGRLIALMGSSGAGKTTLLDVLAQRKTNGAITGDILLNGKPQDAHFSQVSAYCEQTDIHMAQTTVREAIEFSANLRLSATLSQDEKDKLVERTIDILNMRDIQGKLVGTASAEVRKRVTIGVELVTNPSILFLDEPTSGLDSRAALLVLDAMKRAAALGCSIICTIHQPSSEIFEQFDDLLLLQRGGKTVFFGETGLASKRLTDYFHRNGAVEISEGQNPADYMLEQIGAGTAAAKDASVDWSEVWQGSPECQELLKNLESPELIGSLEALGKETYERVGKFEEFKIVFKRIRLMYFRMPEYNLTRWVLSLVQGTLLGLAFLNLSDNQNDASLIAGAMFLSGIQASNQINQVLAPLMANRVVFYRERAGGTYNTFAYFLTTGLVEIPMVTVAVLLFAPVFYFLIGLPGSRFGFFLLHMWVYTLWAVYTGQMFASISPNETVAALIVPVFNMISNVLSGFLIKKPSIPVYWIWYYWINPVQYYNSGQLINIFTDTPFVCDPDEFVSFTRPPQYATCSAITSGDYFADPDDPSMCLFCPLTNGNQLLAGLQLDGIDQWFYPLILYGLAVFSRGMSYIGLRYFNFLNR